MSSAVPIPRRSLLALGASGSGKSETLKHFVDQLRSNPDEPVAVFDIKTDYQDFLEERGVPMIRLSAEGSARVLRLLFGTRQTENNSARA